MATVSFAQHGSIDISYNGQTVDDLVKLYQDPIVLAKNYDEDPKHSESQKNTQFFA